MNRITKYFTHVKWKCLKSNLFLYSAMISKYELKLEKRLEVGLKRTV